MWEVGREATSGRRRPRGARRPRAALTALLLVALTACQPREPAYELPGASAARGRQLIENVGCGACHVIPGVANARGRVGPPLTNFGVRAYVAGQLPNTPDHLVRWLLDPPAYDSATAMPRTGLTDAQARDVAAYLYTLGDARPLGPPHLFPRRWVER